MGRQRPLGQRVGTAAEAALTEHQAVSAVDVLTRLGWLHPSHVDLWRSGRVPCLEELAQVDGAKLAAMVDLLERWARERGLTPTEVSYVARTRDRRSLRFSDAGEPAVEAAYRTHWVSAELSEQARTRLTERASKPPDLVVIEPLGEFTCHACGGTGGFLIMEDPGPLCLTCADMDHLMFLPAGDAALTRRAKKASTLSAVVVRWSRSRKRYERQGLLVEEAALDAAEAACLADAEARTRRRERDAIRHAAADDDLQDRLTAAILARYPACPSERAEAIARHTTARGSGRVGRTAAARQLDPDAVEAAIVAAVRHEDTPYDTLLMEGVPRDAARARVRGDVDAVLSRWREGPAR